MKTQLQSQIRFKASGPSPQINSSQGLLQRQCACGNHTVASDKCEGCRETRAASLQRSPALVRSGEMDKGKVPSIVHEVLRSPGQALDPATRAYFEPRFSHDFSQVRIHADTQAAESAAAVNALVYTVGRNVVFGAGRYSPHTQPGKQLMAHELTHTLQQRFTSRTQPLSLSDPGDAGEVQAERISTRVLNQPSGMNRESVGIVSPTAANVVQRQVLATSGEPLPTVVSSGESRLIGAFDVDHGKTPRPWNLAQLTKEIVAALSASNRAYVTIAGVYPTRANDDDPKGNAYQRAETVRLALIQWIGPKRFAETRFDVVFASGSIGDPQIQVYIDYKPQVLSDPHTPLPAQPAPRLPPMSATAASVTAPLLDLDKGANLTPVNPRIAETVKISLLPSLKNPGGDVKVIAYVAEDPSALDDPLALTKRRESAQTRADVVRDSLRSLGVTEDFSIDAAVKFIPAGDQRDGHITIAFVPKPAQPEAGFDFDKFTTIEIKNPAFSLVIKIPKSIELKFKALETKLTIPKGVSLTLKPVRGIPGLEIGLSGEITKLSDLVKSPTSPQPGPGGFIQPIPGPPLKFSLSVAINGKGYKIESTGGIDLSKRTITAGLAFSLMESGVKYQVPSSVFDDLNKAGAQLQKAINNLMSVTDQAAATRAVGQPPPSPATAPTPGLSDLFDVVDAISNIVDAMDKINKAKEKNAIPTLKIGPTITIPFGPPRAGTLDDPVGNAPMFGIGITGTFQ